MKETTPTPEYLAHCAYKNCDQPGQIYSDMLFPICLCDKHAHKRHETFKQRARS